jgi:hypothetical protein
MAKKGSALVCIPCGREILVTESGTAYSQLWCCGVVMDPAAKPAAAGRKKPAAKKAPAKKKVAGKKTARKKTARKAAGKTGGRKKK